MTFEVRFVPRNEFERNAGVRILEQNRDNADIDGKIFSHTFTTENNKGHLTRQGSVACYTGDKDNAHFLAFEIETKIGRVTTVERFGLQ